MGGTLLPKLQGYKNGYILEAYTYLLHVHVPAHLYRLLIVICWQSW